MTVETATNFTIDQDIITELEASFDNFRSRIAVMSVQACGSLTAMFTPLAPVTNEVIDIPAIEWEQFELELAPSHDAAVLELTAA